MATRLEAQHNAVPGDPMFKTGCCAAALCVFVLLANGIASGEESLARVVVTARKLAKAGDLGTAVQTLEASLGVRESSGDPAVVAIALNDLGRFYLDGGRPSESEKALQRSFRVFESLYGHGCAETEAPLNNLARVYAAQRNFPRAQKIFEQILTMRLATLGELDPKVGITLNNLANVYFARGRTSDSERYARQSIRILEPHRGQYSSELASARNIVALVKAASGDWRGAVEGVRQAVIIIEDNLATEHAELVPYLQNLGNFHLKLRDWHAAETALNRAMAIAELRLPAVHPRRAETLHLLAKVYGETGRRAEAKRAAKAAEVIEAGHRRENSLDHLVSVDDLRQRR
jgi:tetratricopeptide (TPR) repeat protein